MYQTPLSAAKFCSTTEGRNVFTVTSHKNKRSEQASVSVGPRRGCIFCCGPCRVVIKDRESWLNQSRSRRQPIRI
jgi:hypothetical protein